MRRRGSWQRRLNSDISRDGALGRGLGAGRQEQRLLGYGKIHALEIRDNYACGRVLGELVLTICLGSVLF